MKLNRKLLATLGILLTLMVALSVLIPPTIAVGEDVIAIAFIGTEEEFQSATEASAFNGASLAVAQINATDDLEDADGQDYLIELVHYPADNVEEALDAYDDAVSDDVIGILGPMNQTHRDAILSERDLAVPLLYDDIETQSIADTYALSASENDQIIAMADYLVDVRKYNTISLVISEMHTDMADFLVEEVGEDYVAMNLTYNIDTEIAASDARAIANSGADAVFVWLLDGQTIELLKALKSVGYTGQVVYMGLDEGFIELAGADLAKGVIGATSWLPTAYDTDSWAFNADYTASFGDASTTQAAFYYDAVYLLADAVTLTDSLDLRSTLASLDASGVAGVYNNGELQTLRLVRASSNGELLEIGRYVDDTCETCPDIWYPTLMADSGYELNDFTIGLLVSPSNDVLSIGNNIEQAVQLAANEINAQGGLLGADGIHYILRVNTYQASTETDSELAFNEAVADGVDIIFGPDLNGLVLANAGLADAASILQLVSASGVQVPVVSTDDYVFQIRPSDSIVAQAATTYILEELGLEELATVNARTDYGVDASLAVRQTIMASDDGYLVLSTDHAVDTRDMSEISADLIAASPEAILIWSTPLATQTLLDELGNSGWQGTFVAGYLTPDLAETLQIPDGIDVIAPTNWWPSTSDGNGEDFASRYSDRYGNTPYPQSAAYYDAVHLIANGLETVGSSPEELQDWLMSPVGFVGIQGNYAQDAGALIQDVMIVRFGETGIYEVYRYTKDVAETTTTSSSTTASISTTITGSTVCTTDGIMTTVSLHLREEPSTSADVLITIPYQTTISPEVIEDNEDWLLVTYEGYTGYISAYYVAYTDCNTVVTSDSAICTLTTYSDVNLRTEPSTSADVVAVVPEDVLLYPTSYTTSNWFLVSYNGASGYVAGDIVTWNSCDSTLTSTGISSNEVIVTYPPSGTILYGTRGSHPLEWAEVNGAVSYRVEIYSDNSELTYTQSYRTVGTSIDIDLKSLPARDNGWGFWVDVDALDANRNVIASGRIWIAHFSGSGGGGSSNSQGFNPFGGR